MTQKAMLSIQNLSVDIGHTPILHDINLTINAGETHILLGENGAGKSTLGHVLVGKPSYHIKQGHMTWHGENLLDMTPEERLHRGIFMAFQNPVAIPGVTTFHFLKTAIEETRKARNLPPWKTPTYLKHLKEAMGEVGLPSSFLQRAVNDDFSGGEKKRHELAQMLLLEPKLIILDETDSGLDLAARQRLRLFLEKMQSNKAALLVITHYKDLLEHLKTDFIHTMEKGRIVANTQK